VFSVTFVFLKTEKSVLKNDGPRNVLRPSEPNLIVLPALPEEVALHERVLDSIDKEAKSGSLWRKLAA